MQLGIAAGVYKAASEIPSRLLDSVAFVTMGSFTSSFNKGNRELPVTELYDPNTENSVNAKGLPNNGLPDFWKQEIDTLVELFINKYAKLRISISPRTTGELAEMRSFLLKNERWKRIDEIEVNLACPNHRDDDGLHPVLAHDPQAVNDRLKEWSGYPGHWAVKIAPDTPESDLFNLVNVLSAFKPNRVVSANTRLSDGELAGQKMSVPKGGLGGSVLLEAGLEQATILCRLLKPYGIALDACGGITSAEAAQKYHQCGATRGHMATIPYFVGADATARIVTQFHINQP